MEDDAPADRDTDPVTESLSGRSLTKRLKRRLIGDPSKAPHRILKGLLFLLVIATVSLGYITLTYDLSSESSSEWFVRLVGQIAGSPWIALVIALYVWYRFVGFGRNTRARIEADRTGWLTETVQRLSDEVRTTDNTMRIIVTSDDTLEDIKGFVDAALDGEHTIANTVDFYGRGRDSDSTVDDVDNSDELTDLEDPETDQPKLPAGDEPTDKPVNTTTAEVHDSPEEAEPDGLSERIRLKLSAWLKQGLLVAFSPILALDSALNRLISPVTSRIPISKPSGGANLDDEEGEEDVPFSVRLIEEFQHFKFDVATGYQTSELFWRFAVPAFAAFASLMLVSGLWVAPTLAVTYLLAAVLVGVVVFVGVDRRRSSRLKQYQTDRQGTVWNDVPARVKTVETPDTTAYIGFVAGRRFASYDREEFVDELSYRLYQKTNAEPMAPSVLEKYARCLDQMHPNLDGYLQNFEIPAIQREIMSQVHGAPDNLIDKAELAYSVIEHPTSDRYLEVDLGHDPRLVANEYRSFVEDGHTLAEMKVSESDASGSESDVTLVYPSESGRPPAIQRIHSSISDRFHGAHMQAVYNLPDCDPSEELRGHVPSPTVAQNIPTRTALPPGLTPRSDGGDSV